MVTGLLLVPQLPFWLRSTVLHRLGVFKARKLGMVLQGLQRAAQPVTTKSGGSLIPKACDNLRCGLHTFGSLGCLGTQTFPNQCIAACVSPEAFLPTATYNMVY